MTFRRRFYRSRMRKRPKFQWVRNTLSDVVPASTVTYDLLNSYKNAFAISAMLPDIVIWRIHIKISIDFHFSAAGDPLATSGVFFAIFTESDHLVHLPAAGNAYDEHYMMWTKLYASESLANNYSNIAVTTGSQQVIYKEFDIKSHRRLTDINDTLLLQLQAFGNVVMNSVDFTHSTLIKLPS